MANWKNNDTCNKCLFFFSGDRMGICKRYPNTTNKSNDDWCGEWRLEESQALSNIVFTITEPVEVPKKKLGRPKKC